MSRYQDAFHTVEVELNLNEPALVAGAFDLIRTYARAYGLPDIGQVYITLRIEFQGRTHQAHVDEFGDRLDQLWIGQVVKHTAKEFPAKE